MNDGLAGRSAEPEGRDYRRLPRRAAYIALLSVSVGEAERVATRRGNAQRDGVDAVDDHGAQFDSARGHCQRFRRYWVR